MHQTRKCIVAIAVAAFGAAIVLAQNSAPEQKQKAATEKEASKKSVAEEPKRKGKQEGIKVHGHWIIDVKDPDGKVTTHREFENSLNTNLQGGAFLLANLLLGSLVPGGYTIGLDEYFNSGAAPISLLIDSSKTPFCPPTAALCSNNLVAAPITAENTAASGVSLSGSIASTASYQIPSGTIGIVYTLVWTCPGGSSAAGLTTISPAACAPMNGPITFTAAPQQNVPVLAGQTIQATVQITFQ